MPSTLRIPLRPLAVAVSFLAALAAFVLQRGAEPSPAGSGAFASAVARPASDNRAEITRLQGAVRAAPRAAAPRVELAAAYLQRARETGDPGFYARADGLLREALSLRPGDPGALVNSASLALSRHDFRRGLALARRARAAQPAALGAYPALVDALIELGRFGAAERTLQRMIDAKPTLAGYARVSYLRELHGDLDGAVAAMRLAVAAGGPARESVAAVQTLLGGLELARGRPSAARAAHRAALAAVPAYPAAEAGLARLAAAMGDLDGAIRRWRALSQRLPLPEYVIGHGEALLAAGDATAPGGDARAADWSVAAGASGAAATPRALRRAGRAELALVGAEQRLSGGVNVDAELAVFEADHGDPATALRLAQRAWRAAPGLRAADARGWALTRAGRPAAGLRWAHRALRLGSRDPIFRYHAGMAALAAGRLAGGRAHLRVALNDGLAGWPWQAARARAALEGGPR